MFRALLRYGCFWKIPALTLSTEAGLSLWVSVENTPDFSVSLVSDLRILMLLELPCDRLSFFVEGGEGHNYCSFRKISGIS